MNTLKGKGEMNTLDECADDLASVSTKLTKSCEEHRQVAKEWESSDEWFKPDGEQGSEEELSAARMAFLDKVQKYF